MSVELPWTEQIGEVFRENIHVNGLQICGNSRKKELHCFLKIAWKAKFNDPQAFGIAVSRVKGSVSLLYSTFASHVICCVKKSCTKKFMTDNSNFHKS